MLPLQEYVREVEVDRNWWGANDEPDYLLLSWHPHHSLFPVSSALWNLTTSSSAKGHSRSSRSTSVWLGGSLRHGVESSCSVHRRASSVVSSGHSWPLWPMLHFPQLLLAARGHPTSSVYFWYLHHLLCTTAAHLHCCPALRHFSQTHLCKTSLHQTHFFLQSAQVCRAQRCFWRCNLQFIPEEMQCGDLTWPQCCLQWQTAILTCFCGNGCATDSV